MIIFQKKSELILNFRSQETIYCSTLKLQIYSWQFKVSMKCDESCVGEVGGNIVGNWKAQACDEFSNFLILILLSIYSTPNYYRDINYFIINFKFKILTYLKSKNVF